MQQDSTYCVSAEDLQEWLEKFPHTLALVLRSTSNLVTRLDHFLCEDVMLGNDALPHGALWRSLKNDSEALGSLLGIKQNLHDLKTIQGDLEQLNVKVDEVSSRRLQLSRQNTMTLS